MLLIHKITLFVQKISILYDKLDGDQDDELNPTLNPVSCAMIGFTIQFSYMSALFWLTCMSFMIWKSFRRMTVVRGGSYKWGFQNPQFKFFALFAWGCPLLVSLVTITMQYLPESEQENFYRHSG